MRLPKPFQRLKVVFDTARLRQEIGTIAEEAWAAHPTKMPGNSSVRLISVAGAQNDEVNGPMAMTPCLERLPYVRQILTGFGVVWGRTRLMRLDANAIVTQHADINYHWFRRVRVHIPIVTHPDVRFYCGDESVHMAAGEAWIFDNWRQHHVENRSAIDRVHLVADTFGGSNFWRFVGNSEVPDAADSVQPYNVHEVAVPRTERTDKAAVMAPAEVELMLLDLRRELISLDPSETSRRRLEQYELLLDGFCKDWRQMYAANGVNIAARHQFIQLRDSLRAASAQLATEIVCRTNSVNAHVVLEARLLKPMVAPALELHRPVFIVAAPRSGSTLLYETLAVHPALYNLGGEAHWLVEGDPALRVGAPGISSNRLDAGHVSARVRDGIVGAIVERLCDSQGRSIAAAGNIRLLEKTPKNALRISFFDAIFPDALFLFLWREPLGNISSIIEAWKSGRWKTYNGLPGFDQPWSLILPPGWQTMNGRPVEEIAAYQWETTNRIVTQDLARLPRSRWHVVNYDKFIDSPRRIIEDVCDFIGVKLDGVPEMVDRLSAPLPLSRYTQTQPAANKWRKNAHALEPVLSTVDSTWRQLRELS